MTFLVSKSVLSLALWFSATAVVPSLVLEYGLDSARSVVNQRHRKRAFVAGGAIISAVLAY